MRPGTHRREKRPGKHRRVTKRVIILIALAVVAAALGFGILNDYSASSLDVIWLLPEH